MASTLLWALRFLHILSGVAWVGGAFIWSMVIAPRLLARGPAPIRRPVLEALIEAVPRYFYASGGATIVFGVVLLGTKVGWANFFNTFTGSNYGRALGVGVVLALVMLAEGLWVITPTAQELLRTMQAMPAPAPGTPPGPPPASVQAQLAKLGKKMGVASMTTVLFGTLAVAAMTYAVNALQ